GDNASRARPHSNEAARLRRATASCTSSAQHERSISRAAIEYTKENPLPVWTAFTGAGPASKCCKDVTARDRTGCAPRGAIMVRIAVLGLGLIAIGIDTGRTQDIAGIEDCTKTTGLDKPTGCLQSNVNFLQRLVMKNAVEAGQKLKVMEAEIIALKGT